HDRLRRVPHVGAVGHEWSRIDEPADQNGPNGEPFLPGVTHRQEREDYEEGAVVRRHVDEADHQHCRSSESTPQGTDATGRYRGQDHHTGDEHTVEWLAGRERLEPAYLPDVIGVDRLKVLRHREPPVDG